MSTSDNTKLNDLCDDLEVSKLDVVEKISDEELFKQLPTPKKDCPLCFIPLPSFHTGTIYMPCCGKVICSGCIHAPLFDNQGNKVNNKKCPFCRTPHAKSNEEIQMEKKRMEADDPIAIFSIGCNYDKGIDGYPQDIGKALELYHRSGELGYSEAYTNIGHTYYYGEGVGIDKKKGLHYFELAAIGGDEVARVNLGEIEESNDTERALKHYIIGVRSGSSECLNNIKELYLNGHTTKDDYTRALRLYQTYLGEIKSKQRDDAAAYNSERYRYY